MRLKGIAVTVFSVTAMSWLGCGGSGVCDKVDQASRNLANAIAGCPAYFGGSDGGVPVFNVSVNKTACQNALNNCSAADQQALSKGFDCLSGVSRCVPGQETVFLTSLVPCYLDMANISNACRVAFAQ
jgi:hypothetical protein